MAATHRGQSKVYPLKRYLGVFPESRKLVFKFFHQRIAGEDDDCPIDKQSSTALWAVMAAQQEMKSESQESKVVFTDSYYTRHYLGKYNVARRVARLAVSNVLSFLLFPGRALLQMTSNRMKLTGTVKMNLVDPVNKVLLTMAKDTIDKLERGDWALVPVYDAIDGEGHFDPPPVGRGAKQKKFQYKNKSLRLRRKNVPSEGNVYVTIGAGDKEEDILCMKSECAGFIVFKDTKTVVFYTNDLAFDVPFQTPMVYSASTAREQLKMTQCVRGLVNIKRWTDDSYATKTDYKVPVSIALYNMLMNSVDVMDQYRANNMTSRRDCRLSTSLFGLCLDLAVHNAFAVYSAMRMEPVEEDLVNLRAMTFPEFKREICFQFIQENRDYNLAKAKKAADRRNRREISRATQEVVLRRRMSTFAQVEATPASVQHSTGGPDTGATVNAHETPLREDLRQVDADTPTHCLVITNLENSKEKRPRRLQCELCRCILAKNQNLNKKAMVKAIGRTRTQYCCPACGVGFHQDCYWAWHEPLSLKAADPDAYGKLMAAKEIASRGRTSRESNDSIPADGFANLSLNWHLENTL